MNLQEILSWSGGGVLLLLTLIQITPIKFNPWTAIARGIGKALIGGDVMDILQTHITDVHRYRILRFNSDVLKGFDQSKEEYDEILYSIDCYEKYCEKHPDYKNNRCVLAIKNIERTYEERMKDRRFLEYEGKGKE